MQTIADYKDLATIIGIVVAVITYITNSYFQFRNKRIENLKRYFDAHDNLFEKDGFILSNIRAFEAGTYKRDIENEEMEKKFNRFLGDVEKIAFLTSHNAVPLTVQAYMFGWFAQKIQPHITANERSNLFWELAVHYLDELKKSADDYAARPNGEREKYLKKHTLAHRKYS